MTKFKTAIKLAKIGIKEDPAPFVAAYTTDREPEIILIIVRDYNRDDEYGELFKVEYEAYGYQVIEILITPNDFKNLQHLLAPYGTQQKIL
jgi:hypothetical protein